MRIKWKEKITRQINALDNKFNVRFRSFVNSIKKEELKLSDLGGLNPENEINFYLKEFLKNPIVDRSPISRKK